MPESNDQSLSELLDELLRQEEVNSQLPAEQEVLNRIKDRLDEESQKAYNWELVKEKRLSNRTLRQNIRLRRKYANKIFLFTCIWVSIILSVVLLQGFEYKCFRLTDTVLITLITSTTVNVFTFFLLVVKYLFNTSPSPVISKLSSTSQNS